jgi:hypothetical protein
MNRPSLFRAEERHVFDAQAQVPVLHLGLQPLEARPVPGHGC